MPVNYDRVLIDENFSCQHSSMDHKSTDVVAVVHNYSLKQHDLDSLDDGEWLNDMVCYIVFVIILFTILFQVINSYMTLIMDKFMDVHAFSSFFYTKLVASGYKAVRDWNSTVDVLRKRLLFPVHVNGNHWCLISASFDSHKITLYDSLPDSDNTQCMDVIETYLLLKGDEHKTVSQSWEKVVSSTPQQENYDDCGVFVCMNGRNVAGRSSFEFHLDIPRARRHIKCELLNGTLIQF